MSRKVVVKVEKKDDEERHNPKTHGHHARQGVGILGDKGTQKTYRVHPGTGHKIAQEGSPESLSSISGETGVICSQR
jgi:hypothetical protein